MIIPDGDAVGDVAAFAAGDIDGDAAADVVHDDDRVDDGDSVSEGVGDGVGVTASLGDGSCTQNTQPTKRLWIARETTLASTRAFNAPRSPYQSWTSNSGSVPTWPQELPAP